jgi:putative transposase
MPRKPRGHLEAGFYHVTTKSAGPIPLFRDDTDRTDFCNRLSRTVKSKWLRCCAFCLMTTHYHLIVDVADNALQRAMQWLNGTYAQRFNRRYGRLGHLNGARYFCKQIESDAHMLRAFRYVALNPVVGGLCERPQDWPWSSYRGTAGYARGFPFVDDAPIRSYFDKGQAGRKALRAFVEYADAVTEP